MLNACAHRHSASVHACNFFAESQLVMPPIFDSTTLIASFLSAWLPLNDDTMAGIAAAVFLLQ